MKTFIDVYFFFYRLLIRCAYQNRRIGSRVWVSLNQQGTWSFNTWLFGIDDITINNKVSFPEGETAESMEGYIPEVIEVTYEIKQ